MQPLVPVAFVAMRLLAGASSRGDLGEGTPDARAVMERVIAHYAMDTGRELSFVAWRERAARKRPTLLHGRVMLSGHGQIRWEISSPNESLTVVDGATRWNYRSRDHRAECSKFVPGVTDSVLTLLAGDRRVLQGFSVLLGDGGRNARGDLLLRLVGKHERSAGQRVIDLTVDPFTFGVRAVGIRGSNGATHVEFAETRSGFTPDPTLFEFVPPPGTHVNDTRGIHRPC